MKIETTTIPANISITTMLPRININVKTYE